MTSKAKSSSQASKPAAATPPPKPMAILDYGTGKVLDLDATEAQRRLDDGSARIATDRDRALNKR